ncbi:hypothetical protein JCGZ_09397 [Jatropha curcas]|uniref:Uncharacterized protein n=1 Tax=Jatropha curcas TaxID=180498 RepID=A0A067KJU7_JATCU|nr:hypothetical protein JCGZ_09397 [Jatropha curcas]
MENLAQALKKIFLNLLESMKGHKNSSTDAEKGKKAAKSESVEKFNVQERAVKVVKGPKRPTPPKGPPAQTA